jgi:hypothetical protein
MYGLMRAKNCGQQPAEKHRYRLHYCGTCKTMGSLYGQRARMLLNNDAVFFGELLTALSAESAPVTAWDRTYQSYNCFAMPEGEAQMPRSLQVAATATLVMSEFKVNDQIADGGGTGWKLALRVYSQGFREASERLKGWGFPVDAMWQSGRQQEAREAEAMAGTAGRSAREWLDYLSEPTAAVTGMVFQYGAATVGSAAAETMRELGFAFGQLVYLLDALEDFEKDTRKREFNALRAAFAIEGADLPECYAVATEERLRQIAGEVEAALRRLPIAPDLTERLASRLQRNMDRKIGDESCETNTACATTNRPTGFRARWTAAVSLAQTLTRRERAAAPASFGKTLAAPFVFVTVLTFALLAPRFALAATSYRECLEYSLNLMALGAMVSAVLSAPVRLARPVFAFAGGIGRGSGDAAVVSTQMEPGKPSSGMVRKRRPRPGWANSCACGESNCYDCICCCDGIECCCDGAQCCECCAAGECCNVCGSCGECCSGCSC